MAQTMPKTLLKLLARFVSATVVAGTLLGTGFALGRHTVKCAEPQVLQKLNLNTMSKQTKASWIRYWRATQ